MSLDWRQSAACRDRNPDMWTVPSGPQIARAVLVVRAREAIRICETCPVKADCDDDAQRTGVIGQIRAGIPYDDKGRPAALCARCGRPIVGRRSLLAKTCSTSCASALWPNAEHRKPAAA